MTIRNHLVDYAVEAFDKQLKAEKRARVAASRAREALRGMSTEELAEYLRRTEEMYQNSG